MRKMENKQLKSTITGHLTENNELREIFQDGRVTLAGPTSESAIGPGGEMVRLYLVEWTSLRQNQRDAIVKRFRKKGIETTEGEIEQEGFYINAEHFIDVKFPLRFVL